MNIKTIFSYLVFLLVFLLLLILIPIYIPATSFLYTHEPLENRRLFPLQYMTFFGNTTSWITVTSLIIWAYTWLKLSEKRHYGPATNFGIVPEYKANGELYYFSTIICTLAVVAVYPSFAVNIYLNSRLNLRSLNTFGLLFCLFLYLRAKFRWILEVDPYITKNRSPITFEFFRGLDLHPTIFGVNVKQLVVVRLGMMMWQLLIILYFIAGMQINEKFDYGHFVSVLLQSVYIFKTFHLESVLITMIDMTHDRAGFYLIWGGLVWMPGFNAFLSYYFVGNSTNISLNSAIVLGILGLVAIWLNYDVLRQKQIFRNGIKSGFVVKIWGKPVKYLEFKYENNEKEEKPETKVGYLLLSGWWGMARKMNYFWENIAILIWSLPGYGLGIKPFLYLIFMMGLFVHRTFREDDKCRKKYGENWDLYCSKVPYKIVPFVF